MLLTLSGQRNEEAPANGTKKITLVRKEEKQKFVGGKYGKHFKESGMLLCVKYFR